MKFLVAQLGSRRNFLVPVAFHRQEMLAQLFSDFVVGDHVPKGISNVLRPKSMLSRYCPTLIKANIVCFTRFGMSYAALRKIAGQNSTYQRLVYRWSRSKFCRLVANSKWKDVDAVYCFSTMALEIFDKAKANGCYRVLDQIIAPKIIEATAIKREIARYPDWRFSYDFDKVAEVDARERAEWDLADVIVCGSEYVRESIEQVGGPVEKCLVIEPTVDIVEPKNTNTCVGKPVVLTVGTVGLRKGAPYIIELARKLAHFDFIWVGPGAIPKNVNQSLPTNLRFVGPVSRREISKYYRAASLYLLPSVCEGAARSIVEAYSYGLPVFATRESGLFELSGRCVEISIKDGHIDPIEFEKDARKLLARSPFIAETETGSPKRYEDVLVSRLCEQLESL